MKQNFFNVRPETIALLIILIFVAGRSLSVGFLLPDFCHPDEEVVQKAAVHMVRDLTPNPGTHKYPALMFSLTALCYAACFAAANLEFLSRLESWESLRLSVSHWRFDFACTIVTGRLLVIVLGIIALILFYRLFRREMGEKTTLVSLLLLSAAPVFIGSTSILKNDVLVLIGVLLTLTTSLRLLERGDRRSYLLAGAALGICLATKYHAPAVLSILVAHRLRHRSLSWWRSFLRIEWLWSLAAAAVVFFVLSPYTLLNFSEAVGQAYMELLLQNRMIAFLKRSQELWWQAPVLFFFSSVLPLVLGIPLCLVSYAGLVLKVRFQTPRQFVLWSYPVGMLIFMMVMSELGVPHLYLTLAPFFAVAAAMLISPLLAGGRIRQAAAVAAVVGISAYNFLMVQAGQRMNEQVLLTSVMSMERTHRPGERDIALIPYPHDPDRDWHFKFANPFLLSRKALVEYNPDRILLIHLLYAAVLDNPEVMENPLTKERVETYLLLRDGALGYQEVARWTRNRNWVYDIMAQPYETLWPDLRFSGISIYVKKETFRGQPWSEKGPK